jgi:hypothetical protein
MRLIRLMCRLFMSSKHVKCIRRNRLLSSREYSIWAWRVTPSLRYRLQLLRLASRKSY